MGAAVLDDLLGPLCGPRSSVGTTARLREPTDDGGYLNVLGP